jgi:hypothetical protein
MCAGTDEGGLGGVPLQPTGRDDGIAKTAAVEQLGAQLGAQSSVRSRQQRCAGFSGVVELLSRPGCTQCSLVRKALKNLGLTPEQLKERDITQEEVDAPDIVARIEHARANGVPQVYILRADVPDERIDNLWGEIGSGSLMRRLSTS